MKCWLTNLLFGSQWINVFDFLKIVQNLQVKDDTYKMGFF